MHGSRSRVAVLSRSLLATLLVLTFVVASALTAAPRAVAQVNPASLVIFEPLTEPGTVLPYPCSTDRNRGEFVGEGLRLSVTGRCDEGDRGDSVPAIVAGLIVPDGEVRLEMRPVSGHANVGLVLIVRIQEGEANGRGAYAISIHAGTGGAHIQKLGDGQPTILASRADLAEQLAGDGWKTLAVRMQGPNLRLSVNNEPILSISDAAYDSGGVRLAVFRTGDPDDPHEAALVLRNLIVSGLQGGDQAREPSHWGMPPFSLGQAPPAPVPAPAPPPPPAALPPQPAMAAALMPAWSTLMGVGSKFGGDQTVGAFMRRTVEVTGVRFAIGPLPAGVNARFSARENAITLRQDLGGEDRRALAAVLAHEILHAAQVYQGQGGRRDCIRMEVEAFGVQGAVWASFWPRGQGPARTPLEQHLSGVTRLLATEGEPGLYRLVVSAAGYQEQCDLWVP